MDNDEMKKEYNLDQTDDDRDYNEFNGFMIPIICGTFMGLIGGNQITIIFYSQLKNPKDFLPTAIPALLVVLLF